MMRMSPPKGCCCLRRMSGNRQSKLLLIMLRSFFSWSTFLNEGIVLKYIIMFHKEIVNSFLWLERKLFYLRSVPDAAPY